MSFIAAIDAGASEIKACIFDLQGNEVASASRSCPRDSPETGWAQYSSDLLTKWPVNVLKDAINSSDISVKEIHTIGVTGSRATIVPFGKDNDSVGPLIFWYDRRAKKEVKKISKRFGVDEFFNLTGIPLDPTPSITKIMWWRDNQPEIFDAAQIYALPQTVVLNSLTGDGWYCDDSNGSYLGFLNLKTRSWEENLLDIAGISKDNLPKLVKAGTVIGNLSNDVAMDTGLSTKTQVVISGSDASCFKLGAGVKERDVACMYIGTAGVAGVIINKPIIDSRLTCCPAVLPDHWDLDGLLLTAGSAYSWVRDLLGGTKKNKNELSYKKLDELAATIPAGSDGVLVVPHLAGAGSPIWNANMSGLVSGLRLSHGAAHLVRAVMEGVVFAELHALDAIREHVHNIKSMQLTGGGGNSSLWSQIMADTVGLPVSIPKSHQSTCLGAAMMAGVASGIYSNHFEAIDSMTTTERMIEPNLENKEIYDIAYQDYLNAVETLK